MITQGNGQFSELLSQVRDMDGQLADAIREERNRAASEPENSYYAGESTRLNPVPSGVNPYGADADEHYPSSYAYYLIGERGRHAVRNNGLVEQGINRLCSNLRIMDFELDVDSGDEGLDAALKDKWTEWCGNASVCDYEGERVFPEIARQSFFSQVQDGDIDHLPLRSGHIQTWENHHIRNPWGSHVGSEGATITHGVEKQNGRTVAHWIADQGVRFRSSGTIFTPHFSLMGSGRYKASRYPVIDSAGNRQVFRLGFFHRFWQGRGISRLSAPRESMNGFERLNWSNIHSSVKRSLISYLMSSTAMAGMAPPTRDAAAPTSGPRYSSSRSYTGEDGTTAVETVEIETPDGPATVVKTPLGWQLQGWNANLPPAAFFEHASLMLTILSVNLDLPLMYLLLDGSKVNFHGGRMIADQVQIRWNEFQSSQKTGLWLPTFEWKLRQWATPGAEQYDEAIARGVERQRLRSSMYRFRNPGRPYVKPLEDVTADKIAVESRIRSAKRVLAKYGIDYSDHVKEVVQCEDAMMEACAVAAKAFIDRHPELNIDVRSMFFRFLEGGDSSKLQLNLTGAIGGGEENNDGGGLNVEAEED